jgi:hypothetical protein
MRWRALRRSRRSAATASSAWQQLVAPTDPRHTDTVDIDAWPLYERGRIEHEHGDPHVARGAPGFLSHWSQADREPWTVADARRRLQELEK